MQLARIFLMQQLIIAVIFSAHFDVQRALCYDLSCQSVRWRHVSVDQQSETSCTMCLARQRPASVTYVTMLSNDLIKCTLAPAGIPSSLHPVFSSKSDGQCIDRWAILG